MKAGLLIMGNHAPERSKLQAHQWDLDTIIMGDKMGYEEVWIGEHFAALWEPLPTAEFIITQALMKTKRIRLGTGVYLLPFHHPVDLAHRISYLDHLSQGRIMIGIGSGALPVDIRLFNINYEAGQHREMTREALEVMLFLWQAKGPSQYKGKYWTVNVPSDDEFAHMKLKINCEPFTKPHPPIAVAAGSPHSQTLKLAGERGYIPLTLGLGSAYLASQWDSLEEGARAAGRKPPPRSTWRVVRDVWIDDTDEKAFKAVRKGMMWRAWTEYLYPVWSSGPQPIIPSMKHDVSVPDSAVTMNYILENVWLVGSPDTVARKLRELYNMAGGFGMILLMVLDHFDDPKGWEKTMRLFKEEVMPRVADLKPK
ncbi:MAG: LLM class flavin-dependent oxidoreductase [SAR202 cluster bacterium]|nr:LLM class flavin-dependent oxidoreductase [SAR202 cluster bacterium]